jgi:hypothetical protein
MFVGSFVYLPKLRNLKFYQISCGNLEKNYNFFLKYFISLKKLDIRTLIYYYYGFEETTINDLLLNNLSQFEKFSFPLLST